MRRTDWMIRLFDVIESTHNKPFEWGVNDCCLFAANCVEAITDVDYAAKYRGKYSSEKGAYKLLKKSDIRKKLNEWFGEPKHPLTAKRGDVVMYSDDGGEYLGICLGTNCAFVTKDGLHYMYVNKCSSAWSID